MACHLLNNFHTFITLVGIALFKAGASPTKVVLVSLNETKRTEKSDINYLVNYIYIITAELKYDANIENIKNNGSSIQHYLLGRICQSYNGLRDIEIFHCNLKSFNPSKKRN